MHRKDHTHHGPVGYRLHHPMDGSPDELKHRRGGTARRHHARGWGGVTVPAIFAALLADPAHGYDLRQVIEKMTGEQLKVDPGGLYRMLRRLEADGFLRSSWQEGASGPQRRSYELTDEGREVAADWATHLRGQIEAAQNVADALDCGLSSKPND
jgi:DNA-binding PadR family transcriptional regulator